jgi:hypothetical protein
MQVAQGSGRDDAAVVLHNIVRLRRDATGGQAEQFTLSCHRMGPDDGHRLQHGKRVMYFSEEIFLTQIQAGPDELQPDRSVDYQGIDAATEQRRIRCGKMAGRAEALVPQPQFT